LFLDSISKGCEELIIFAYSPIPSENDLINYQLKSLNVRLVSLGPHNSLPKRVFRFVGARRSLMRHLKEVDVFLVRSPTPLLLVFATLKKRRPIIMYLVGDYVE